MGRYLERAENNARFLNVNFNLELDTPTGVHGQWEALLSATSSLELYKSHYSKLKPEDIVKFIGFDTENPNSICSCIRNARENARMIRENLTKETWEEINDLYHRVNNGSNKISTKNGDARKFFDKVRKSIQLLYGMADCTVSRTEGWHFLRVGQYLERADNTTRILDVKYHIILPSLDSVGTPLDIIQWASLLKSVSAYNMYRRLYGRIVPFNIAQFLILDNKFPRAVFFCLQQAELSLIALSGGVLGGYRNEVEKRLGMLRSELEYEDMKHIFANGLHEYLDDIQLKLIEVSNAIHEVFFQYGPQNQKQTQSQ
jgi:uncharacterized alpha-E superfamily protein